MDEILGETLTFPASHIVVPQIIIYFVLVYALHNIVNGTENFKRGEILLALVQITLFHFIKILLGQNTIQVTSKYSGLGRNLNWVVPEFERAPNFLKNWRFLRNLIEIKWFLGTTRTTTNEATEVFQTDGKEEYGIRIKNANQSLF